MDKHKIIKINTIKQYYKKLGNGRLLRGNAIHVPAMLEIFFQGIK
jgi:hypothetical protein